MNLQGKRILITGASGGIGRHLSVQLAKRGANLLLADLPSEGLQKLQQDAAAAGTQVGVVHADLSQAGAAEQLAKDAGEVDVLINLAGIASFRLFQNESAENIARLWQVNVVAPAQLTRALLPAMLQRKAGRIVNVGSIFGSIGFACFANYSATKFAVRGLSEALRRELEGTGVDVTYVAPRYTKTPINAGAASRMAAALKMNMDEPELVAANIIRAIENDAKDYYIGFPECLFVRINAILPRVVDGALRKQNRQMKEFAINE